jgi:hypothetical protein
MIVKFYCESDRNTSLEIAPNYLDSTIDFWIDSYDYDPLVSSVSLEEVDEIIEILKLLKLKVEDNG